jgi:hypothetical protein
MANTPLLVTEEQAKFIRQYRYQKMKEKLAWQLYSFEKTAKS